MTSVVPSRGVGATLPPALEFADSDTAWNMPVDDPAPRRHRRHSGRRRAKWRQQQGHAPPTTEAQDFGEFASRWAPYGGAPNDEIFVRFGMTLDRFCERLWQLVDEGEISVELSVAFSDAFPPPIHVSEVPRPPTGASDRTEGR